VTYIDTGGLSQAGVGPFAQPIVTTQVQQPFITTNQIQQPFITTNNAGVLRKKKFEFIF
jgi:hypothetical protein